MGVCPVVAGVCGCVLCSGRCVCVLLEDAYTADVGGAVHGGEGWETRCIVILLLVRVYPCRFCNIASCVFLSHPFTSLPAVAYSMVVVVHCGDFCVFRSDRESRSKVVSKAMSDLVAYVWPVSFKGFEIAHETNNCYHMSSFHERKALRLVAGGNEAFLSYTARQLARVYPHGTRILSTNYNPLVYWQVCMCTLYITHALALAGVQCVCTTILCTRSCSGRRVVCMCMYNYSTHTLFGVCGR